MLKWWPNSIKVSLGEFLLWFLTTEKAFFFLHPHFDIKNTNVLVKHINSSNLNHKVMIYNIQIHGNECNLQSSPDIL